MSRAGIIVTVALLQLQGLGPAWATDRLVSQGLSPSSYTASSTYGGHPPWHAFDGDLSTYWNAAAAAPEWIEVDLGQTYFALSRIRMTLNISPDGNCAYEVWTSTTPIQNNTTGALLAAEHSGSCQMGQVIELFFVPDSHARHLQVRTVQSAGWAAWFEIEVFATCSDSDSDGYFYEAGCGTAQDCNDATASTHPGAPESCDGYDNDCDGQLDNSQACDTTCDAPGVLNGQSIRVTDDPAASGLSPAALKD